MTVKSLNARQEAFCQAYVRLRVGSQAAIEAGYSVKGARQVASTLLTYANILARVQELADEQRQKIEALVMAQAEKAVDTLEAVMDGIKAGASSKGGIAAVQAANSILDRSGLKPIEKLEHGGPNGGPIPVQNAFAVPLPASDADAWAKEHGLA
ncbi:terminase small subunit [Acidiferrobacter sp.]|uniref:terminase small subunit n=1 Tax=Acidiferrobacter sp. TaxID=1872107 RepID=UPI00261952E2|nr:terminase small subunit [Acidiferrobacter sp.]